ncbi:MAG: PorT family protein [Flavobacteriales bacterium]|nr:PorT family protein [Flavobacteriales bacterium]
MKPFLTAIAFLFILSVHSQVEIRPFIGGNLSNITDSPDGTSTQAKLGVQVGSSVMIGNKLHLNPGIAWFSRSTEYSGEGNFNLDQTIEGVIIPLLVGYRLMDPSSEPFINLRVFGGPSMMFLTKTEVDNSTINEAIDWSENQWGAQIGAGIDISIFFADISYEFGLSDTGEGAAKESNFSDFKQNTFIINAGVRLSFSR